LAFIGKNGHKNSESGNFQYFHHNLIFSVLKNEKGIRYEFYVINNDFVIFFFPQL